MKILLASKLFRKILGIILLCLLISQGLTTFINQQRIEDKYLRSFQFNARSAAIQFEELILEALDWGASFSDVGGQNVQHMDMFFAHPEFSKMLTHIAVIDLEGNVLGRNDSSRIQNQLPTSIMEQIQLKESITTIKSNGSYDTYVPIIHRKNLKGFIMIGFKSDLIDSEIQRMLIEDSLLIFVSLFIFMIGLAVGVFRSVTKPLQHIIQKIQQIQSSSDTTVRIDLRSNDEIGRLGETFNQLMDFIEEMKIQWQVLVDQLKAQEKQYRAQSYELNAGIMAVKQSSTKLVDMLENGDFDSLESFRKLSDINIVSCTGNGVEVDPMHHTNLHQLQIIAFNLKQAAYSFPSVAHMLPEIVHSTPALQVTTTVEMSIIANTELQSQVRDQFRNDPVFECCQILESWEGFDPSVKLLLVEATQTSPEDIKELLRQFPNLKVVILCKNANPGLLTEYIQTGVRGLVDSYNLFKLPLQIRRIYQDELVLSGKAAHNFIRYLQCLESLNPAEKEVLYILLKTPASKEIACALSKSHRTVENQITSILKKLACPSKKALLSKFQLSG